MSEDTKLGWVPEPEPHLMGSINHRYRVRRTAKGWAIYDHALGERVSVHLSMGAALRHKTMRRNLLRQVRDNA